MRRYITNVQAILDAYHADGNPYLLASQAQRKVESARKRSLEGIPPSRKECDALVRLFLAALPIQCVGNATSAEKAVRIAHYFKLRRKMKSPETAATDPEAHNRTNNSTLTNINPSVPVAQVVEQTDTQVVVRCPYCDEKHTHGRLRQEAHLWMHRGGHCSDFSERKGMRHKERERRIRARSLIERLGGGYYIPGVKA